MKQKSIIIYSSIILLLFGCIHNQSTEFFVKANELKNNEKWQEAIPFYKKALKSTSNADSTLKYYLGMSNCYTELNKIDSLSYILDLADSVKSITTNPKYLYQLAHQRGVYFVQRGKLLEGKIACEKALRIYETKHLGKDKSNKNEFVTTCMNYSNVLARMGVQLDRAILYSKKAVAIGLEADTTNYIGSLNCLANAFQNNNQFDSAVMYYNLCADECDRLNNSRLVPFIYNNVGTLYVNNKLPEKGLEYLLKATELDSIMGNANSLILDYGNTGYVLMQLEKVKNFCNRFKIIEYFF